MRLGTLESEGVSFESAEEISVTSVSRDGYKRASRVESCVCSTETARGIKQIEYWCRGQIDQAPGVGA
jgi:hypothetical protein